MRRKLRILIYSCFFFWIILGQGERIAATAKDMPESPDIVLEFQDSLDYGEIQKAIDDIQIGNLDGTDFNFKDYVQGFIKGEKHFNVKTILEDTGNVFLGQLRKERGSIVQLVGIAIVAAIFTSFTNVFKDSQIAETGFYVTYLLLFTLLTATFYKISAIAGTALDNLKDFMMSLLPTYAMGIAFATGSKTSMFFYETTLGVITIVDFLLIHIILPMINVYFVLLLANNITKQDMLSKMSEFLEKIISWALKTVLAAVIGISVIQNLIIPVTDQVKKSVLLKTAQALPGVGNTMRVATESILQASLLIKNAIGAAGLIVIIVICLVPVIKLAIYQLIYSFGAAIVQPISDKRILNCINAAAKSAKLLMSVVMVAAVLFLFTIVIVTSTSSLT
ncbi:stage III sporulation protein AE [[Clostridium] polysaccharolyticum]|uniref:Stage III sporulation protein AE n=1 Tax=[Clostridium] polysaccharolyticum TaxID=29364 RepID=A0A1H9ZZI7_9FIRM|nr:stage III sporulation protein AE [[Clostridium] polysaccharolyticum]SES87251.1 stage III sporulation protein AE [[Clostridium] polysaccharolyticum]